ncbi:hypothetical protein JMJ35_002049 [Cladonia borealis]|uniref:Uncharacterized protein n=1 Tax=Cladonia borealis TaxID=184061 RepID=A0AA39V9N1_9LECA|nr:hypothetical protein JMJ35_002049 [Cladonia borealis]
MADSSADEENRHHPKSTSPKPAEASGANDEQNHSSTTLTATELREKLLREKVKALRKSSSTQKSPTTEDSPSHP